MPMMSLFTQVQMSSKLWQLEQKVFFLQCSSKKHDAYVEECLNPSKGVCKKKKRSQIWHTQCIIYDMNLHIALVLLWSLAHSWGGNNVLKLFVTLCLSKIKESPLPLEKCLTRENQKDHATIYLMTTDAICASCTALQSDFCTARLTYWFCADKTHPLTSSRYSGVTVLPLTL